MGELPAAGLSEGALELVDGREVTLELVVTSS